MKISMENLYVDFGAKRVKTYWMHDFVLKRGATYIAGTE